MWTIRILLTPDGANLRSEIALPDFALQSFGILSEAPVLLGRSKWICTWLSEKRNCKFSSTGDQDRKRSIYRVVHPRSHNEGKVENHAVSLP